METGGRVILIPSFNSGRMLAATVASALGHWPHVRVVVDGSTDGSPDALAQFRNPGLRVERLPVNAGKGAAVVHGARAALADGFTHGLVLDADGQHPCDRIPDFLKLSILHPNAMILGVPEFGADAPPERVYGRLAGNFFTSLETLWGGIGDSLFGFRLYPLEPLVRILGGRTDGRGFDFETVAAVRLFWEGVRPINVRVPVRYPPRHSGGVSHFHYARDNALLARVHAGLCFDLLPRLLRVWHLSRHWRARS